MVKIINNHLLEVDFEYSKIIDNWSNLIISEYKERKKKIPDMSDFTFTNYELIDTLGPKLCKIVEDLFIISEPKWKSDFGIYVQTSTVTTNVLHTHLHNAGTICGVFYYNIPKEGGEVLFKNDDVLLTYENVVKPKLDKLYLFPVWMPHSPLPHKDVDVTRISFNWHYPSNQRGIYKENGVIW